MVTRGDDWIPNQIFWRGLTGYEGETTPIFYRLAQESAGTIDVGAYVGLFSLLAAIANPSGNVYAFEPMESLRECLLANCAANGLENVNIIAAAVGNVNGTADFFHVDNVTNPSSSSLSYEFMRSSEEVGQLRRSVVTTMTLDRFCSEREVKKVDLVKIDTETTEAAVIEGMHGILRRDRPHIVCEVLPSSESANAISRVLSPLGYFYYRLTDTGSTHYDCISPSSQWHNHLFSRLSPQELHQKIGSEGVSVV